MSFDHEKLSKIWNKGKTDPNNKPTVYRKDVCGAWIRWEDYGKNSRFGWNVDHIVPEARGGTDHIDNLQPLHWENNARKSDGNLSCPITSLGNKNIRQFE